MTKVLTLDELPMSKKKPPASPPPEAESSQPTSETVRLSTDLVEMLREICFNTRDERNRRVKATQFLDGILRPILIREHQAMRRRLEQEKEGEKPSDS